MSYTRDIDDLATWDGEGVSPGYAPGSYQSADWALIATMVGARTEYRSVNFAAVDDTTVDLNGTYSITSLTADTIILADPASENASWENIETATAYASPTLSTSGEGWAGPFIIDMDDLTEVIANFVAPQGMYLVTKKGKDRPRSVTCLLEVTPVDNDDEEIGASQTFTATIEGDGKNKAPRGVTLRVEPTVPGRCKVRARRLTAKVLDTEDTIVDEVRWRDGYGLGAVTVPHFGDITTLYSRTFATPGALGVKERKLNCRVTRKVLQRNEDDTFGPTLVASDSAADIICHMALDPYIGGRDLSELDVPQIYGTVSDVATYFGFEAAGNFGYTFDQDNLSSEEMIQTVAQAIFCTGYRQGSRIRLFFEHETDDSTLLLNHRNTMPGSQGRTVRFGLLNDNDGVELDYISAKDGASVTIYRPADRSAAKPKKLQIIGVQDERVATIHADRAWNKIRYQHTTAKVTALAEASQLVLNERIEIADNTRADVIDGNVVDQDGLTLTLSQPFEAADDVDYSIFLQLPIGEVEALPMEAHPTDKYKVVLQAPPSQTLPLDPELWAEVVYQIVGSTDVRSTAFLVAEKGAYNKKTIDLQAINYDPRYYQNDHDHAD